MDEENKKLYNQAINIIKSLNDNERDIILKSVKSIRAMTIVDLYDLTSNATWIGCSGCPICCTENEIGID